MCQEINDRCDQPESRRFDALEQELTIIIAKYRGEPYDPEQFDAALVTVYAAFLTTAIAILRPFFGRLANELAENARFLLWRDMTRGCRGYNPNRGTLADYVYGALVRICFGRENLRDVLGRQMPPHKSSDDRQNPIRSSGVDRRQVPLTSDPVDHRAKAHAAQRAKGETVDMVASVLSDDDRDLLIRFYIGGENAHDLATSLGTTETAINMRLHKIREKLRERFKGLDW